MKPSKASVAAALAVFVVGGAGCLIALSHSLWHEDAREPGTPPGVMLPVRRVAPNYPAVVLQNVPAPVAGTTPRAGVSAVDIILTYGQAVPGAGDLPEKLAMAGPIDPVRLEISRNGTAFAALTGLGNSAPSSAAIEGGRATSNATQIDLGLAVRPPTTDEREQVGVAAGLRVQGVSGPSADAGIQTGDIVLSIDGDPVASAAELCSAVHAHDKEVAGLIQRGEALLFIPIHLPSKPMIHDESVAVQLSPEPPGQSCRKVAEAL
jgi:S1-C subfamily serine protease